MSAVVRTAGLVRRSETVARSTPLARNSCSATAVKAPRAAPNFWAEMLGMTCRKNLWRVARGTWWHLETRKSFVSGSANGNRTRYFTVQFGSVGSKWLCFRSSSVRDQGVFGRTDGVVAGGALPVPCGQDSVDRGAIQYSRPARQHICSRA